MITMLFTRSKNANDKTGEVQSTFSGLLTSLFSVIFPLLLGLVKSRHRSIGIFTQAYCQM